MQLTTRPTVDAIYMARVYLAQARTRRHFGAWHATLLRWAAGQRAAAMRERLAARDAADSDTGAQIELF